MAKWKLTRQIFGKEEFKLSEGENITIGRAKTNNIVITSVVISRDHCILNVKSNEVLITDLMSSNGVYVGDKKIPQNTPHVVRESDIIGFGWTCDAQLTEIDDKEKFIFKLTKEKSNTSLINTLHNNQEYQNIENKIGNLNGVKCTSDINNTKPSLKRKLSSDLNIMNIKKEIKVEKVHCPFVTIDEDVIALSDSDNEIACKISKQNAECDKIEKQIPKTDPIKSENEFLTFEAFNVKQEYEGYEEPIQIDSDSDSESEQWYLRLSQSSPGKPFIKMQNKIEESQENSSYSQLDDFVNSNILEDDEEEFIDDIILIPAQPPEDICRVQQSGVNLQEKEKQGSVKILEKKEKFGTSLNIAQDKQKSTKEISNDQVSSSDDIPIPIKKTQQTEETSKTVDDISKDVVDGFGNHVPNSMHESVSTSGLAVIESPSSSCKKAQMIDPLVKLPRRKSNFVIETKIKTKSKGSSSKSEKIKKHSSDRQKLTSSQKEERKKKLKELASKEKKECETQACNNLEIGFQKLKANVKITASNRGAFLSTTINSVTTQKDIDKNINMSPDACVNEVSEDTENKKKLIDKAKCDKQSKSSKHKDKYDKSKRKSHASSKIITIESREPLKSLKSVESAEREVNVKVKLAEQPVTNLSPPIKQKKKVRFSEIGPQVHIFEIEPGNKMKKTSLVKSTLGNIRQFPVFSLEKITLMKILRWNPHWLDEQVNNNEPPPILGHNHPPMSIFHSFVNHNQYVQLIGDLLLMEIWECLTVAHMKMRNDNNYLQMRIGSLPPMPSQDRYIELFNLSVDVSLPSSQARKVPRVGEIILVNFGPENARNQRFFYVHGVRCMKSPPNNMNSFYCISLYATFTEKMKLLRPGEVMFGKTLAYISKELMLFEAMEYLAGSPLSEAILKPEPQHFPTSIINETVNIKSQFTVTLNASQQLAVRSSVSAALNDRPCIQMVQGPPGTGKSSVICAIVMTYFYDAVGKRQQNRRKILICATSNAAVDELVIRLLNIRQRLPKTERFRMVRVGRAEAMHPRAHEVSSQQLAHRDVAASALQPQHTHAGAADEILHLEAKINMWKTAEEEAKDPVRVAYCKSRISDLVKRLTLVRSGSGSKAGSGSAGGDVRPEQVAQAERRIIEGADIIVTTLASAHNFKMKGLKRRIALCIVDEAGQAIEPETLIPLTLDVTCLTLIGDPQQLPGYICSQRAKKHGLSESLFSRLSSCTEHWAEGNPLILLNQQYRMHPEIADYPNRAFYDAKIQTLAPRRTDIPLPPYTIVSIPSGDKGQGVSGANETEAWGVSRLAAALARRLRADFSLAVITPYNAHKELIKKYLRTLHDPSESQSQPQVEVEVNTVDSFQGQERDVVVVSLARSQGVGFLTDMGRMNVMLTRAKHAMIICLNPHAMLKHQQWRTLVEDAQRRHVYRELPFRLCQPISSDQVCNDDILKYVTNDKSTGYPRH